MVESRVTLSGGVLELAGRLSEEDRQALVAIIQSAADQLAPDDPEVSGFSAQGPTVDRPVPMTASQRDQLVATLADLLATMSSTDENIVRNL